MVLFSFMSMFLQTTKRTGWIQHNIELPESIAEHMYRMGIMCLLFKDSPGIDYSKCIKMALVHDLAESIVGDITPQCGVSRDEKCKREEVMCRNNLLSHQNHIHSFKYSHILYAFFFSYF